MGLLAGVAAFGVGLGCAKDRSSSTGEGYLGPGPDPSAPVSSLSGPKPTFGPTVSQPSVPAVSGGTLLIAHDGHTAIAADPDRDALYVVELHSRAVRTIALQSGDEPGRVVEDGAGKIHVVLRGAGAVVDIDPSTAAISGRRVVCPAPRGIAYDAKADHLLVACTGGELVTLPASGSLAPSTVQLLDDLRDVAIVGGQVYVSRFRTAEVLLIASDHSLVNRQPPLQGTSSDGSLMNPTVAWRMVGLGSELAVVHQLARVDPLRAVVPYYTDSPGTTCTAPIVESTVSFFDVIGNPIAAFPSLDAAVLPVDIAFSRDEKKFAVVAAGNGHTPELASVYAMATGAYQSSNNPCVGPNGSPPTGAPTTPPQIASLGEPTAVGFDSQDRVIVQTREPATLYSVDGSIAPIALSSLSREDTGHAIFHSNSGGYIACASCHAEGGEDGHVWSLDVGLRRTQALRGTLQGTAPYHWDGDLVDIPALAHQIYTIRMNGDALRGDQAQALQSWLYARPAPALSAPIDANGVPVSAAAIANGKALFESTAGCSACHAPATKYTNNQTLDVGTGGKFQVPSLIGVAWRAPYLHTGCAATLKDRFDPSIIDDTNTVCGGNTKHGNASQLTQVQLQDLIAYLQTL